MSLFNLFKKSPQKDSDNKNNNATTPSADSLLFSPEMQKKRYDAATEFLKIFQGRMPLVNGKPHAGTVLSISARLAGTSLFRAINKKEFPAGNVILSEEANQAYPQLLNLFAYYCKQNGTDVLAKPPATEFPQKDKPLMDLAQIQAEYQDTYNQVMNKHGLDHLESARAGMVVCSIVFEYHCKRSKDIDPFVATGIVAMGVVEGTKTAPLPLGTRPKANTSKALRVVLGERDIVIQEALDNGGKFIDPGPEALKLLKQSNIDPYLVYEKALRQEVEARIPRIDFVRTNVDEVFNEWNSKDHSGAPIHIRLAIWLKNNASSHGYQQEGNSWVLKP